MKITFYHENQKSNVEKENELKTSYRTSENTRKNSYDGIKIDISGTVMDNAAYSSPERTKSQGKTLEECRQDVGQVDLALQRNYMAVMSNSLSTEDYAKLQEGGFDPGDMSPEEIVTVVDQIKAKLAEAGVEVSGYTDTLDESELEAVTGNKGRAINIENKLKEQDLPTTQENIEDSKKALQQAKEMTGVSENAIKYMVTNQMEPTIENIYLAEYSSGNYYTKKAEEVDFNSIKDQIDKVIETAGLEVNDESRKDAEWMIEKGLPLTPENLELFEDIKNITFPINEDQLMNAIGNAKSQGKSAVQASLVEQDTYSEKAKEIYNKVQSITDTKLQKVVNNKEALTIDNLTSEGEKNTTYSQTDYDLISAKRLLEETRLQMTVEANIKLLKSNYSIETADLSQLVDSLKELEQQYYDVLFGKNTENLADKMSQFKETTSTLNAIKFVPADVVAKISSTETFTLKDIEIEGSNLKNLYEKAGESYESLKTEVRGDLGDSIKKAFRNIDDLLEELGLPKSADNERAVRILGYNQMSVNEKSINQVKEADQKVNRLIEKMTPANTLQLIKEGVNPLKESIDSLTNKIDALESTDSKETEKYSKFLWKLEKEDAITEEEREAYIGIYRLLCQIEKSDGALIGNVLNQNAELSLGNLLSASRSRKQAGMNISVDDNFGGLESLNAKDLSISDQIEKGFTNSSSETNYYQSAAKEIMDKIDPYKLHQMNITLDATVDEVLDNMREISGNEELEIAYRDEQAQIIRNVNQSEASVIQRLIDVEEPVTVTMLQAANDLLGKGTKLFKKLNEYSEKQDKDYTNLVDNVIDEFNSKGQAESVYQQFCEESKEIVRAEMDDTDLKAIDIKELKLFHKELNLMSHMSQNECYEIPITIDGETSAIHLQIVHGKESGKVQCTLYTEKYGNLASEFKVSKNIVSGYMAADSQEGLNFLKSKQEEFASSIKETGKEIEEVQVIRTNSSISFEFDPNQEDKVSTPELYKIAKTLLMTLKNGNA